jgi:hypothetical protein
MPVKARWTGEADRLIPVIPAGGKSSLQHILNSNSIKNEHRVHI